MKPSFALNLSDDGVTLLHRTARGWMDVGRADFADPDFTAALEYLRSTAMGLSPKGIATKLVIPNSQILFVTVDAPGPSDEERRAQIRSALEGRTPYAVDDLSFDWSVSGSEVNVAVVAKETLGEAEAFATEHRFNPVSFVAIPETGFASEPFFGTSSSNAQSSSKVEPDEEIIRIVSREAGKATEEKTLAEPKEEPAEVATETSEEEQKLEDPQEVTDPASQEVEAGTSTMLVVEDEVAPKAKEAPEPKVESAEADQSKEPVPDENSSENDTVETAEKPEERAAQVAPVQSAAPPPGPQGQDHEPTTQSAEVHAAAEPEAEAAPSPSIIPPPLSKPRPQEELDDEEAPMAVDVQPEDDIPPMPSHLASRITATKAPVEDDVPPLPSAAALMAFASRRSTDTAPAPKAAAAKPQALSTQPAKGAGDASPPRTASVKAPTVDRPAGAKPPPKFSYDDPVPPPPRMPGDPPIAPMVAPPKPQKSLRSLGNLVTAPGIPGTKSKKPVVPKPTQQAINPAETTTASVNPDSLARGLGARRAPQRGKPRYLGLIMTGILLLMLAIVAAWSSIYLTQNVNPTENEASENTASLTSQPEDQVVAAPDLVETDVPTVDDEAAADGEDVGSVATDETAAAPEPEAVEEPPVEEAVVAAPEPAPETGLESNVATSSAPSSEEQDEIFLAGMDTPPSSSDPLTLPTPSAVGDTLPDPAMPPPPFGTVYQFDEDGRIIPTADGIMTPEGVLLVAGKPSVLPPARPVSVTEAAAAANPAPVTTEPVVEAPLLPAETYAADPDLATSRPRNRPEGLVPAAPAAGEDDASLAPAEDSRFASLRPRLRPAAVLAAGEESRLAAENASLAAQAAINAATNAAVAEANSDGSISPMAVAVSRIPAPRPRDLNRAVEAAVAAAVQPSSRKSNPTPEPPSSSEEGDDEPETASAAPRIPTRATVAKQATYVNAINLSKVNLIGVYGTQSKRYALIRQSNGRYKKVRIGDSFDGGTIKAITANEVRYQKGGRLISLTMPKG